MRAALYIRVSTEEQVREGFSIEAQKNKMIQYCQITGHDIIGIYIDDGISGKDLKRPEVTKMLEEIKSKDNIIEAVIVYKLDRITRSIRDLLFLIDLFDKNKVMFASLTENIDTSSATGRMFTQLLGIMAEWERATIAERVEFGIEQRAVGSGIYLASVPPYGYDYCGGKYIPIEAEAQVVKEVFKKYISGSGGLFISKELRTENIKTKAGTPFYASNIYRMIKNNVYRGYFLFRKHNADKAQLVKATNIEPIIDNDTFLKCQKIRESRGLKKNKKPAGDMFVFHPKLKCACGNTMQTKIVPRSKTKTDYYYYCQGPRRDKCTDRRNINVKKMEGMFIEFLSSIANKDIKMNLELNHDKIDKLKKECRLYNENLARGIERKKRLQYLYIDDKIDNNSYLDLLSECDLLIKKTSAQIKMCEAEIEALDNYPELEKQKTVAINILKEWNKLSLKEKKEFVGIFIYEMIIQNGKIIEVNFII